MLKQILWESGGAIVALISGIYFYRKLNAFYRIMFLELLLCLLLYSLSHLVTSYQRNHNVPENNHWVFNINTASETVVLLFAAYSFFSTKPFKLTIVFTICAFIAIFSLLLIYNGPLQFNVTGYSIESFIIIITFSTVIFVCTRNGFATKCEVWASAGLVLFFAGNLPYFSAFNFLTSNYFRVSESMYLFFTLTLQHVRFLLLAIGFYFSYRTLHLQSKF